MRDGAHDREIAPVAPADPGGDAGGDEALRGGDAHTEHAPEPQPRGRVEPEREVRVLHRLAGRALAEVVDRADHDRHAGRAVGEHADLGGVGSLHASELGRHPFRQHAHDLAPRVRLLEQRAHVRVGAHVTRREQAAAHRQQVRHERDREAELLRDLGAVAVRADGVRREVLEHEARVRAVLQRRGRRRSSPTSRRRHVAVDDVAQRREREQRRRRVAARVRDQRPSGGMHLRQPVAPRARREPVPVLGRSACRAAGARRRDRRRPCRPAARTRPPRSFPRQRKITSAPLAAASAFVTNVGRLPFSRGSSALRRAAGERVGAERDQLEPGMGEHPVERLLAGVAGGAEDRGGRPSVRIMHNDAIYAPSRARGRHRLPGSPGRRARASPPGEACFTTAMTGYEEAVTDPSYVAQVLCFAYPLIGTYGVDEARMESERVQCEGVVMRDVRPEFAAWLARAGRRRAHRGRHADARAEDPRRRRRCAARSATRRSRSCTRARSPSR